MVNEAILRKDNPVADALVRRRQHVPDAGARRRDLRPVRRARARRPCRPRSRSTPQHRVTPIDDSDVCVDYDKSWFGHDGRPPAADLARRPDRARATRTSRSSRTRRRRRPGSRSCSRRSRRTATSGWQAYWTALEGTTACASTTTGPGLRDRLHRRRRQRRPADRRLVRFRSRGRRHRFEPAPRHAERRRHRVDVLPPGRVRGRAARRAQRRRRAGARRLHVDAAVPGRHAAADVREPDRAGARRCRRCSPSGPSTRRTRTRCDPATISANRNDWIKEWTDLVVR